MKQALIDSLFYLTACIISGVVVIFLFIGFPILIIDWLLSAQLTQSEAFLTFTIKNPLKLNQLSEYIEKNSGWNR